MFEDLFDPSEAFSIGETLNSARVNAGIGAEPSEVGGLLELVDKSFEIIFFVNAADDGADKLGARRGRGRGRGRGRSSGERAAEEAGGERHRFCFASTVTLTSQMSDVMILERCLGLCFIIIHYNFLGISHFRIVSFVLDLRWTC